MEYILIYIYTATIAQREVIATSKLVPSNSRHVNDSFHVTDIPVVQGPTE